MRAAPMVGGVVILLGCGAAAHGAVREVETLPNLMQWATAASHSPPSLREPQQRLVDLLSHGDDAGALVYLESLAAQQPVQAAALHETLAGAYFRDRRLYRATQHLDAIPAARRSDQARYLMAHVAARQQRLDVAMPPLEQLARRLPDDPLVARDEAQIASLLARHAQAAEACERILRQYPADTAASLLLAQVRVLQRRLADAERLLSGIVVREPRHGRAALQLGLVQVAMGKPQAARQSVARARAVDPANAAPHAAAAALELLHGDRDAARRAAAAALKHNPADPLGALVDVLATTGGWAPPAPASPRFLAAGWFPDLETDPLPRDLQGEIASTAVVGRIATANLLLEQLAPQVALDWLSAEPVTGRGPLTQLTAIRAQIRAGETQAAAAGLAALEGSRAGRDLVGPFVQSALLASRRNDPGAARAAMDRAIQLAPDSPRMRMLAGDLSLALGQPERAVPQYRAALARWPREPRLLNQLAYALALVGAQWQREEALALTGIALQQQPHYLLRAALLDTRADLLFRLGRRREALNAYRELSTTVGGMTTPEQWHRLGDLAREAGDAALARKAYEEALDYGRAYPGRDEAARQLATTPAARPLE